MDDPLPIISLVATLFVGLINIVLTLALTVMVHRFSRRSTEVQILQSNNHQWQDLNIKVMENPRWQALMEMDERKVEGEDALLLKNMVFYILNIVHEVFLAQRCKLIGSARSERIIAGQIDVLRCHRASVETLLALGRGYDPDFCRYVRTRLNRDAADDFVP